MRNFLPAALLITGLLVLTFLGFLFKAALGRYLVVFLLGFFGLSFVVALVAFLLFVFTVSLGPGRKD